MIRESYIDELIMSLYSAVVDSSGFSSFLKRLNKTFNLSSSAILLHQHSSDCKGKLWIEGNQCPLAMQLIAGYNHMSQSERKPLALAEVYFSADQSITGESRSPPTNLYQVDYYLTMQQELGYNYMLNFLLDEDKYWHSQLLLHRHKHQGKFSNKEKALIKCLQLHLHHAMQLHRLKLAQEQQLQLTTRFFNQIKMPVLILNREHQIYSCNLQAERFFKHNNFVSIIENKPHWHHERAHKKIQCAIEQCSNDLVTRHIQVKMENKPAISLIIVPLIDSSSTLHQQEINKITSTVAICIYNKTHLSVDKNLLCSLYGLSTKEVLICEGLINGLSPHQIAAKIYLSYETVRSYIKRIMHKTDTKRQGELVVKILASPACNHLICASHKVMY